jgi:hypothetical protein
VLTVGCTTIATTRYFLPTRENPIYRPGQAIPVLQQYVQLQCPAFRRASGSDSGAAHFSVEVDSIGYARRAELRRASGDSLLDDIFGTVAAQLSFPPDSSRRRVRRETVRMIFRCAGDSAIVRIDAGFL